MNFDKLSLLVTFAPHEGGTGNPADQMMGIVKEKHRRYATLTKRYCLFYDLTRLSAGLGAGLLPFTLQSPPVPTIISAVIVVTTVLDVVFNPKNRWGLYSQATDLIALAMLKSSGHYDKLGEPFSVILRTEEAIGQTVTNLEDMVKRIKSPQAEAGQGQGNH